MKVQISCHFCVQFASDGCEQTVGGPWVCCLSITIFRPFYNCIDKAKDAWQETHTSFCLIYILQYFFKSPIVVICVGHVVWALFLGLEFGFFFCHFPWVSSSVIWVKGRAGGLCFWQGSLVLKPQQWLGLRICFISSAHWKDMAPNDHW